MEYERRVCAFRRLFLLLSGLQVNRSLFLTLASRRPTDDVVRKAIWLRCVESPRCFNCECPGHVASDCDSDPLCGVCLKPDHPVSDCPYVIFRANLEPVENPVPVPSYKDATRHNRLASPVAARSVDPGRKRKADHETARSPTPDDIPVGDPRGSPERSTDGRGKVRWRESPREDHQPHVDRSRDDRHPDSDDLEGRHQRDERCENRRLERDRGRESKRERRREGHHPREGSSCDCGGNHDRRRSPDRRLYRDKSPVLFSSDSDIAALQVVMTINYFF